MSPATVALNRLVKTPINRAFQTVEFILSFESEELSFAAEPVIIATDEKLANPQRANTAI